MINSPSTPTSSTSTRDPRDVGWKDRKRHPAGRAHYPGDVSHIVGEVKGPGTFGGLPMLAVGARYDPDADRTDVEFAFCLPTDPTAQLPDGTRRIVAEVHEPPPPPPTRHDLEELAARRIRAARRGAPLPQPRRRGGRR